MIRKLTIAGTILFLIVLTSASGLALFQQVDGQHFRDLIRVRLELEDKVELQARELAEQSLQLERRQQRIEDLQRQVERWER